eukprot:g6322.t1
MEKLSSAILNLAKSEDKDDQPEMLDSTSSVEEVRKAADRLVSLPDMTNPDDILAAIRNIFPVLGFKLNGSVLKKLEEAVEEATEETVIPQQPSSPATFSTTALTTIKEVVQGEEEEGEGLSLSPLPNDERESERGGSHHLQSNTLEEDLSLSPLLSSETPQPPSNTPEEEKAIYEKINSAEISKEINFEDDATQEQYLYELGAKQPGGYDANMCSLYSDFNAAMVFDDYCGKTRGDNYGDELDFLTKRTRKDFFVAFSEIMKHDDAAKVENLWDESYYKTCRPQRKDLMTEANIRTCGRHELDENDCKTVTTDSGEKLCSWFGTKKGAKGQIVKMVFERNELKSGHSGQRRRYYANPTTLGSIDDMDCSGTCGVFQCNNEEEQDMTKCKQIGLIDNVNNDPPGFTLHNMEEPHETEELRDLQKGAIFFIQSTKQADIEAAKETTFFKDMQRSGAFLNGTWHEVLGRYVEKLKEKPELCNENFSETVYVDTSKTAEEGFLFYPTKSDIAQETQFNNIVQSLTNGALCNKIQQNFAKKKLFVWLLNDHGLHYTIIVYDKEKKLKGKEYDDKQWYHIDSHGNLSENAAQAWIKILESMFQRKCFDKCDCTYIPEANSI